MTPSRRKPIPRAVAPISSMFHCPSNNDPAVASRIDPPIESPNAVLAA
ncbi:hypothetical protein KOR34_46190 [Posidoniimonas corsicana]|uniref:Uncharacterized protein n=1 Tax=Posidoniimonas corsicana TaxID=1938618 RepID=A0A5C5UZZ4_9BACT|nr:hypothetical protein KOR34_46190 [Posidoniimonas corsicana]